MPFCMLGGLAGLTCLGMTLICLHVCISFQIMQADHVDEHEQLASHVTPSHALSSGQSPFFLSRDALNFAALDYLIGLTGKVCV